MKRTAALVGATGGAGTTRLCLELAAILAHDGRDVAILDAAFATQGLARHAPGRIDTDTTALLTDDADPDLADALVDHPAETAGRLALCPTYAPFERLARAKTARAARRFETLVERADGEFDHVLVDTPPVAANQSFAAVNAVDSVALVAPASRFGADAVQGMRGRLADLGTSADAVLVNRADDAESEHPFADATAIPTSDAAAVERVPTSAPDLDPDFSPAIADAAESVFDTSLDVEFPEEGLLDIDAEKYLPDALS
ncbi:ParA family protein [Haladaptatus salinisoli]|uniref:ParA family protein n=1 Tax=Haladaptatus salinisoli TaxID=2884876 RepID=UPI001D0AB04C|nr:ParA family protein [Haladaptatus salinisoli]